MSQPPTIWLPSLIPRATESLWYAKVPPIDEDLEELEREESDFEKALISINQAGKHFKPIGCTKDLGDEDEEDEGDDDDMDDSAVSAEEPEAEYEEEETVEEMNMDGALSEPEEV